MISHLNDGQRNIQLGNITRQVVDGVHLLPDALQQVTEDAKHEVTLLKQKPHRFIIITNSRRAGKMNLIDVLFYANVKFAQRFVGQQKHIFAVR